MSNAIKETSVGLHFLSELTMLTDNSYPTYNFRYSIRILKPRGIVCNLCKHKFLPLKYGLIINLVWALGMVCGMVWEFHTIPHTIPSYHTIFYSMPSKLWSYVS